MALARPDAVADVPAHGQTAGLKKCVDRPIKKQLGGIGSSCPAARAIHVQAIQGLCGPLAANLGALPPAPHQPGGGGSGRGRSPAPLAPPWPWLVPSRRKRPRGRKEPCTGSICLSFPSVRGPASVAAAAAFPWCITARTSGHGERPFQGLCVLREFLYGASRPAPDVDGQGPPRRLSASARPHLTVYAR